MAAPAAAPYDRGMCRNIRVLHNFDPPTTDGEIRDAALQYVRKVSGVREPAAADAEAFGRAVDEVAASTRRLLGALRARTAVRTREGEREKARARAARRFHAP
ncbi:conserved hypothetical protein [Anaeromyxobacter dehalogenans 2CP-1]|uniref:DUF2277 domain-containing protein n=2 Tax=Anaeromyxobacter dehalogenans TaxID=161493 RepID=B8J5U6_ANAD2|nr:conserved hypothetical protein [Anaeromyxobacter dehalogenans 2CP-1]